MQTPADTLHRPARCGRIERSSGRLRVRARLSPEMRARCPCSCRSLWRRVAIGCRRGELASPRRARSGRGRAGASRAPRPPRRSRSRSKASQWGARRWRRSSSSRRRRCTAGPRRCWSGVVTMFAVELGHRPRRAVVYNTSLYVWRGGGPGRGGSRLRRLGSLVAATCSRRRLLRGRHPLARGGDGAPEERTKPRGLGRSSGRPSCRPRSWPRSPHARPHLGPLAGFALRSSCRCSRSRFYQRRMHGALERLREFDA